jgi:hypothetical protein
MAELPADGWTFVSPELSARESYVTTIPFTADRGHLYVNAELPAGRGALQAEILDAENDRPLAGYSRQDCRELNGVVGEKMISWNHSDTLPLGASRVRFRFYLTGPEARLYSYWFH